LIVTLIVILIAIFVILIGILIVPCRESDIALTFDSLIQLPEAAEELNSLILAINDIAHIKDDSAFLAHLMRTVDRLTHANIFGQGPTRLQERQQQILLLSYRAVGTLLVLEARAALARLLERLGNTNEFLFQFEHELDKFIDPLTYAMEERQKEAGEKTAREEQWWSEANMPPDPNKQTPPQMEFINALTTEGSTRLRRPSSFLACSQMSRVVRDVYKALKKLKDPTLKHDDPTLMAIYLEFLTLPPSVTSRYALPKDSLTDMRAVRFAHLL